MKRNVASRWIVSWAVLLLLGAGPALVPAQAGQISGLEELAYRIGDALERHRTRFLDRTLPILSTSYVNLDDLNKSSPFGRLLGVMVASRFSQHGYRVLEVRLDKQHLVIQEGNGELALSRSIGRVRGTHEAQAIIVGTYTTSGNRIYVCTRLVDVMDNTLISSCDVSAPVTGVAESLLQEEPKKPERTASSQGEKDPIASGSVLLKLSNPLAAKIVQAQLARLGYYHAKLDGIWKSRSKAALAAFKRDNHLPNEQAWDLETQIALFNPRF